MASTRAIISAYSGGKQIARQHVSFTYIKATDAPTWVDPQFAANWSGAAQGGIPHDAYHFYSACSTGAAQARNFLRGLPTAVDAPGPGQARPARPPARRCRAAAFSSSSSTSS
jgi:hypothetical protein